MNTKFRILKMYGYPKKWAKGKPVVLPIPSKFGEWDDLPNSYLGKSTFDKVC
jgi:hypothetical protein